MAGVARGGFGGHGGPMAASPCRPPRATPWPVLTPLVSPQVRRVRSVVVNRPVCVVGARSLVHLPLDSPLVSRTHVLIVNEEKNTYLRDLASRNRVFINGAAVREAVLADGNLLRVGPFAFCCRVGPADERPPDSAAGLVIDGGRRIDLSARTLVIGHREECDLPLRRPMVSSVHAVIFRRDGQRFVRDLLSETGTFLNGRAVREAALRDGDQIRIGLTILRYQAPGGDRDVTNQTPVVDTQDVFSCGRIIAAAGSAETLVSFEGVWRC